MQRKPKVLKGQEWERSGLTIRIVAVGHGRVDVESLMSPGRWGRRRSLIAAALSNTPTGYRLVKEALDA